MRAIVSVFDCLHSLIYQFVFSCAVISWQWLREQSIRFCLQGEGGLVLPLFLPLTFKPLYEMLVEIGLYRDLWHFKVWHWLCLPDLQFRTSYCDFLHARWFCANLPALLLDLRWYLGFLIRGLEIHWGKIFNVDWQTRTIDVSRCVTFIFTALLQLYGQITRSEMSFKDKSRM